ncbi:hypothetical protein PCH_Pc22g04510 [Penicillium rubens Wisconsin 54-1255]|uniref:Uncharacterized protein n=1 Tax=Penicillium rubens (strain ATCC 28089 / DSM 1075 / NRRL 1951 / Wisconsin 54-1255) TaxID=500485 RepID=B6HTF4_PENRW|nr:hypothetical protein PCH_Pc22g04510 [Penicillium rubens Wisconsin 54-1255]
MATNSTQNETPAWVAPVAAGGYGLIGLIVVVVFLFCAIRFWVRKTDPEWKLIYHFDRQVAKIPKAVKAAKKIEKKRGQRTRWGEWTWAGFTGILGRPEPQPAGTDDNEAAGDRITRPVLPVFVEPCDTAAAEGRLEDVDCNGLVVRWVPVPRGHRLAKKTKKANALAEVVGALKGKN